MSTLEITSSHIKNLGHNIQEIRERALKNLVSKLKYGFKFDNKLARSQETLQLLFRWFEFEECEKQEEVLALMYFILKSSTGQTIIHHIGSQHLKDRFHAIEHRISMESVSIFNDIMDLLGQHDEQDVNNEDDLIPPLNMTTSGRSDSNSSIEICNDDISCGTYRINQKIYEDHNKEKHVESGLKNASTTIEALHEILPSYHNDNCPPNFDKGTSSLDDSEPVDNLETMADLSGEGITVFILPWVDLWPSDVRSLSLVAEALLVKCSVRRCCRFLIDVLSKDFPANVFLNRPSIAKSLLLLIGEKMYSADSMEVLLVLVNSIKSRIKKLHDVSLVHSKFQNFSPSGLPHPSHLNNEERKMCEHLLGYDEQFSFPEDMDERMLMLHQLPVPHFCLDFLCTILENIGLSAATCDDGNVESLLLNDFNLAVSLCLNLLSLLMETITSEIWRSNPESKIAQQIIEKSVEVMRTCGETLNRLSYAIEVSESKEPLFRIALCRLLNFGLKLSLWCEKSALMSPTLSVALQKSLLDAPYAFIHQDSYEKMTHLLGEMVINTEDEKELKMYTETLNVCLSMTDATTLLRMATNKLTKEIIPKMLQSIASIEFHSSRSLIDLILGIFLQKISTWKLSEEEWCNVRKIILSLLSHSLDWVQELTYHEISSIVSNILGVSNRMLIKDFSETTFVFLLHESIFTEICCHGLSSQLEKVSHAAKEIMTHFLRGKLLLSDSIWKVFIHAITPAMPILHAYAAHDDILGNAIIKTLDIKIGRYMLIPNVEIIAGNVRMLFVNCYSANMEAANNILYLLQEQTDSDNLLPKLSSVRPDTLVNSIKNISSQDFNIAINEDQIFYQESTLFQVMELLSNDNVPPTDEAEPNSKSVNTTVDASFRRSALSQLSVMLQQPSLHGPFFTKGGCELIYRMLKLSLDSTDTTLFPECSKLCITIINSVCSRSATIRHWASKDGHLFLYILRAIYIFYGDNDFLITSVQMLMLISYGQYIINNVNVNENGNTINTLALPYCLTLKLSIPFGCTFYWKNSTNRIPLKSDMLYENESIKSFLRIHWNVSWYGGVDVVTRWPYVPALTEAEDFLPSLKLTDGDLTTMKLTCPVQGSINSLYRVQNSTTHAGVNHALSSLLGYLVLMRDLESGNIADFISLPWQDTFSRFLTAPPASPKDAELLISVLKFLNAFVLYAYEKDLNEDSGVTWILKIILDTNSIIMTLLSKPNPYSFEYDHEIEGTILKQQTLNLVVNSVSYHSKLLITEKSLSSYDLKNDQIWEDIIVILIECLKSLNLCNFYTLGYLGNVMQCILDILMMPFCKMRECTVLYLIEKICEILYSSHQHQKYNGYKGLALLQTSFSVLCCMIDHMIKCDIQNQTWNSTWFIEERMGIFRVCLKCYSSESVTLRAVILQFLSGLANVATSIHFLDEAVAEISGRSWGMALSCFLDMREASLVRVQAAHLLVNLIDTLCSNPNHTSEDNLFDLMRRLDFENKVLLAIKKVCCEPNRISVPDRNISVETLMRKEEIEVAFSKHKEFNPSLKVWQSNFTGLDAPMVTAIVDVVSVLVSLNNNRINFQKNHFEMYRMIFRCLATNNDLNEQYLVMYSAICKMLGQIAAVSQEAADALLDTIDCISVLLRLFIPVFWLENKLQENLYDEMLSNAFIFVGNLLSLKKGYSVIWKVLYDDATLCFFETLLITIRSTNSVLQRSATYCITKLLTCCLRYDDVFDNAMNIQTYIDVTPAPISYQNRSWNQDDILSIVHNSVHKMDSGKNTDKITQKLNERRSKIISIMSVNSKFSKNMSIESIAEKCMISEELCWIFLELYKILCMSGDLRSRMVDIHFEPITTAICAILASSSKARIVSVEKNFLAIMLKSLIELHNYLSLDFNPNEIFKEIKNSPVIFYLNRILQLLANNMIDCEIAKENCADGGLICILSKMWPFCIMTEDLRITTSFLLQTYTNSCLRACQTMHVSTGLRCLLMEIIDLLHKEIMLVSSKREPIVLCKCLKVLENCCCEGHCRTVILKSDIVSCISKLHPAVTKRRNHWIRLQPSWEHFLEVLSRYPNGQEKVMDYSSVLCALIYQSNGLMLRTLSNCAFNPSNRTKFMQSAEIICLFCTILSSEGPIDDKVTVCITLWALAANNHKSKLTLKNAGVAAKLQDSLTKLKLTTKGDKSTERAIQIMDYVSKILNNQN